MCPILPPYPQIPLLRTHGTSKRRYMYTTACFLNFALAFFFQIRAFFKIYDTQNSARRRSKRALTSNVNSSFKKSCGKFLFSVLITDCFFFLFYTRVPLWRMLFTWPSDLVRYNAISHFPYIYSKPIFYLSLDFVILILTFAETTCEQVYLNYYNTLMSLIFYL